MPDPGVSKERSSSLKRRNLRCGGEVSLYSQNRLLFWSGNGRLHSHRLARHRRAIDSFFSPARTNGHAVSLRDYKKASFEEEKIVFPIQASSTQYE